jgi:NADH-quinone oxidoreductase subunit C
MSDERTNEAPRPTPAQGSGPAPDTTSAAKEEIATDVSEVARQRLSDTDKTQTAGSIAEDAADAAPGVAGTPADDDTAAKVEAAPTATDAPATAAGAAAATAEAEKKPEAPATSARPAAAGARPAAAGAGRPGAKPAAAAAPPKPPEPDPEEVTSLRELVPDLTWERRHGYLEVKIPKDQLVPIARKVKGLGYDYLSAVTAVDWRDRVEMLYHCYGWDYVNTPGCVVLRADLPPEPNPVCPSLTTVWAGAELQEREIYDLFGVKFVGHPDLRRILLDDNFPGHPLRKDWTFDYEYVLVKHLKYGAEGQDAPPGGEEGFRRV